MNSVFVVGLDAYFGACDDLQAFARAVAHGLRCAPVVDALQGVELALRVADRALFDAGVQRGERVAVVWAGDVPAAMDIKTLWGFAGPAVDVQDDVRGDFAALEEARRLLADGTVDVVLIGETGRDGGVALVLTGSTVEQARVYAVIDGVPACAAPGYWEWPALAEGEIPCVQEVSEAGCALGSVRANVAWGVALPLAALVRAVLCLHHRVIPATPDWGGPRASQTCDGTPFFVAMQAQPWLVEDAAARARRVAWVSSSSTILQLREPGVRSETPRLQSCMSARPFCLFPLAADTQDALQGQMQALRRQVEGDVALRSPRVDLQALADESLSAYRARRQAAYALVLLAHDADELLRELDFAVKGVEKAFATGQDWASPLGSAFTARPQGREGTVAFVYPGAFNSYVGMGRDLFQLFPHLHERFAEVTRHVSRATAEKLLYPRSLVPSSEDDLRAATARLHANPTAIIESGASFAILYTSVMRDVFGVRPTAALGYSLGEISMLWALGVWPDGDAGSDAWNATSLFETRLFGPQDAVREYWGLEPASGDEVWCSYIVKAPVDKVRQALSGESRVYLTIVNEAKEAVIAGHPADCARVIASLGCHALRVPFEAVIHAPAMLSEYGAFADLYSLPTRTMRGIDFYSATEYKPLLLEREALARAMAQMTCHPVDFPRLVQTVYDAGVRIFVELGPLGTCSRWIGRILRGQPHAVVPINKSGKPDYDSLLPVLAMLVTHRAPVNLEALCEVQGAVPAVSVEERTVPAPALSGAHYMAEGHLAFLESRRVALQQTGALMAMQFDAAGRMLRGKGDAGQGAKRVTQLPMVQPVRQPALFSEARLREFATGDVVRAFGPAYEGYRNRRIPRLPNGELLCVSRVLSIDGEQGKVTPGATLLSEFDVPVDAWFYRHHAYLPTSVLIEIALQPCGVLSTYLGSMLPYPGTDFYFRNLDGEGAYLRTVDVRGKTITNRVTLLNSTAMSGIIIQKFGFELACEDVVFYHGMSSFGYFEPQALQRQAGLDNGRAQPPWLMRAGREFPQTVEVPPAGLLGFLDKAWCVPGGSQHGRGYVYAEVPVSPDDWFFACHFYQDPVMPGSLGVEAMVQALQVYALEQGLGRDLRSPRFAMSPGSTVWKYRGQVTPEPQRLGLEVHLRDVISAPGEVRLVSDASLWKGDLRIYAVEGLGIRMVG